MARFIKKPVVIDAITFDELVEYGIKNAGNALVNGMPWSFQLKTTSRNSNGDLEEHVWSITHEDDNCYLIPTLEGTMKFRRGDMLITGVKGEIYPCKREIFDATYDPEPSGNPQCDQVASGGPPEPGEGRGRGGDYVDQTKGLT